MSAHSYGGPEMGATETNDVLRAAVQMYNRLKPISLKNEHFVTLNLFHASPLVKRDVCDATSHFHI